MTRFQNFTPPGVVTLRTYEVARMKIMLRPSMGATLHMCSMCLILNLQIIKCVVRMLPGW